MFDLERLEERYIVVAAEGQPPYTDVDDLRELEGEFGKSVHPLWSDELQSIVAWAFDKGTYDQAKADEWVREAMEPKGARLMDIVQIASAVAASVVQALGLQQKQEGGHHIATKREGDWYISSVRDFSLASEDVAWSWDTDTENAVLGDDDWERFASAHLLVDMSQADEGEEWPTNKGAYKLPVAKMVNGRMQYVWNGAAAANAALSGARAELDAAQAAKESAAETLRGIYRKFDKDPDNVSAEARVLMAFGSKLQAGGEAEPDEDDGLVWKEIIHPGEWHKMDSGRVVKVTADIIRAAYEAFKAGLPKYVSVPAGGFHPASVAAEENRGFVENLKIVGDRLFGGFRFTNPMVRNAVEDGSIADCSVYLEPEVVHPETGEKHPWALTHVLLTNDPLVQDLEPFGAPIPASASGHVTVDVYVQDEEDPMPEQNEELTLSAEDQSLLEGVKGLGLSAEEIKALVAQREQVEQKTRDLEVTSIVRALEGKEEHEMVTQVEDTRHWPVVVSAAEKALRERPRALGLSVADGRTELDEVVLSVVNAIPADARMQVGEQPAGSKQHKDPTLEEDSEELLDAKAEALSNMLTPRKGAGVGLR